MTKPRRTPKPPPTAAAAPDYVPTPAEADLIRTQLARRRARPPAPRVKLEHKPPQPAWIEPDHPDRDVWTATLRAAFGTTEPVFAERLMNQLLAALHRKDVVLDQATTNAALAAMHGLAPRDEAEAMLCAQMVATHNAALDLLGRAVRAEYRHTLQDGGNLAVKLLRTYTAQLEALQRYRGKTSQQKVTVEHVHVHAGGQAVVGAVATAGPGGRGSHRKPGNEPMHGSSGSSPMHRSPRCGARTRGGSPCRSPAVGGKRGCRMHGGAVGSGGQPGNRNALRHGRYTAAAIAERRALRDLLREARRLVEGLR